VHDLSDKHVLGRGSGASQDSASSATLLRVRLTFLWVGDSAMQFRKKDFRIAILGGAGFLFGPTGLVRAYESPSMRFRKRPTGTFSDDQVSEAWYA
jgi:hypothetical protein